MLLRVVMQARCDVGREEGGRKRGGRAGRP